MTKAAAWTIAVALVIAAIAAMWLAGEMHYGNCLASDEASAKHFDAFYGDPPGAGCSRLPF